MLKSEKNKKVPSSEPDSSSGGRSSTGKFVGVCCCDLRAYSHRAGSDPWRETWLEQEDAEYYLSWCYSLMFCLWESQQGTSKICAGENGEKWAEVIHLSTGVFMAMTGEHCFCRWWKGDMHPWRWRALREKTQGPREHTPSFQFSYFHLMPSGVRKTSQCSSIGRKLSCTEQMSPHHVLSCCTVQTISGKWRWYMLMTFIKTCNGFTVGRPNIKPRVCTWELKQFRSGRKCAPAGTTLSQMYAKSDGLSRCWWLHTIK